MKKLFRLSDQAVTDHCQECGAEEFSPRAGLLETYLVVESPIVFDDEFFIYTEMALCETCVKKNKSFIVSP